MSTKALAEIEQLKQLPWRKDPFLGMPIDQALGRWLNRDKVRPLVDGKDVSMPREQLEAVA